MSEPALFSGRQVFGKDGFPSSGSTTRGPAKSEDDHVPTFPVAAPPPSARLWTWARFLRPSTSFWPQQQQA